MGKYTAHAWTDGADAIPLSPDNLNEMEAGISAGIRRDGDSMDEGAELLLTTFNSANAAVSKNYVDSNIRFIPFTYVKNGFTIPNFSSKYVVFSFVDGSSGEYAMFSRLVYIPLNKPTNCGAGVGKLSATLITINSDGKITLSNNNSAINLLLIPAEVYGGQ